MSNGKQRGSVAILHDTNGVYSITRTVNLGHLGTGDVLTHNGKLLIVAALGDIEVFDVHELEQPIGSALMGTLHDGSQVGAVYAATSRDDHLLFVSEEGAGRIAVYHLGKWRIDGFKGNPLVGYIPAAIGPVGLALSPDGRWLYSTSEAALPRSGFGGDCKPESNVERWHAQGLLLRIDVARAATDPRRSISGALQARCNPVRVAVSPDGAYLWVTARGSGLLLQIPANDLNHDTGKMDVSSFQVGGEPVGVAVRPDGNQVWVALSNRFAKNRKKLNEGRQLVGLIGIRSETAASVQMVSEPASEFPRDLSFLPDGRTLAVGLFRANRIEFVATPP